MTDSEWAHVLLMKLKTLKGSGEGTMRAKTYNPPVQHNLVKHSRGILRCKNCGKLFAKLALDLAKIVLPCSGRREVS